MSTQYLRSKVGTGKIGIIVLGIIILVLGLHSHFQSAWARYDVHQQCRILKPLGYTCPSFSMEQYYVAMIIICFILSLGSFIISMIMDTTAGVLKLSDMGYHGVCAFLLFIAGIVYIVSAEQIHNLGARDSPYVKFRRGEKLAAGALTIFQAVLYGVVALFIGKN